MRLSFGLGRLMARALASISGDALLTNIAASPALREDFTRPIYSGPARQTPRSRAGWSSNRKSTYHVPHGEREKARRLRQGAHARQIASHRPGTVQPRHIFGSEP